MIATKNNDRIFAEDGDDRIIASLGNDTIDGGVGNDRIDYRSLNRDIDLNISDLNVTVDKTGRSATGAFLFDRDRLVNVERIIGNPNRTNRIVTFSSFDTTEINNVDIDLAKGLFEIANPYWVRITTRA